MNNFIHIGLAFPGPPKIAELEPTMTHLSSDWIRYSALNWILWTDRHIDNIARELETKLSKEDQYFVTSLDITSAIGRLSPWIWDWIKSKGVTVKTSNNIDQLLLGFYPPQSGG